MASAVDSYTLKYFNTRGIGEPLRMLLSIGKIQFSEIRYPKTELWPRLPEEIKQTLPWGIAPVLELSDGKVLSQSKAIGRYLARKLNLGGSTDFEAAKCDEIVDAVTEFFSKSFEAYFENDPLKKSQLANEFYENVAKPWIEKCNNILQENKSSIWFVGDNYTWADVFVAYHITQLQQVFKIDFLGFDEKVKPLRDLVDAVYNIEGVKYWVKNGPPTEI